MNSTTVDQIPTDNGPCNTNRYWDYDNSIEVRLDPSQDVNSQNIYEYYCKHWHRLSWPNWETYKDMIAGKITFSNKYGWVYGLENGKRLSELEGADWSELVNMIEMPMIPRHRCGSGFETDSIAWGPIEWAREKSSSWIQTEPKTGAATADTIGTVEIRTPERELVDMILKEEMSKILGPLSPDEERLVLHSREMANVPYPEPPSEWLSHEPARHTFVSNGKGYVPAPVYPYQQPVVVSSGQATCTNVCPCMTTPCPPTQAPLNNAKPLTKTEQNLVDFCNSRLKPPQKLFNFLLKRFGVIQTHSEIISVEVKEMTRDNGTDGTFYRVTYELDDGKG